MSTILKALKQAEKENPDQEGKNRPSFNVLSTLSSRMQQKKPNTFLSLGKVVSLFALVIVLILFSYDFFSNNKSNYHPISPADKKSQVLETQPDIVKDQKQTIDEFVITPSDANPLKKTQEKVLSKPADEPKTITDGNALLTAKEPVVNHPEKKNLIKDEKILANKSTAKKKILPLKNNSLKIQAISWTKKPAGRIAVIDNRVLVEGDSVQGYRLVTIEKDSVILHDSDNDYRLKFNH